MAEERLQKILARAGVASRRASETLIAAGRVTVNGKIVHLGDKADAGRDDIRLDGRPIKLEEAFVYIAVHKPRHVLTMPNKDDRRKSILDLVGHPARLFAVGRLDTESEGLVLLTNDGELANRLTHPRYGHEKEYRVLVARHPDREQLETWRRGVVLEDGYHTAPAEVRVEKLQGKGAWLRVIMREGRKRQIREVAARLGLPVVRLVRVRIGALNLGSLKRGQWRELAASEVSALKKGKEQGKRSTSKKK